MSFRKDFIAGGVSGAVAKTIVAPIERVKLLLQLQRANRQISPETAYKGMIDCFLRIPKEQGFLSYWRGNLTNVLMYFPIMSLNFAFKVYYKNLFMNSIDMEKQFWKHVLGNLVWGGAAGVTSSFIVFPLDFARTHLSVDVGRNIQERRHKGLIDVLFKTIWLEGPLGLYRGFPVSALGIFIYRSIYFGSFDTAKDLLCDKQATPNYVFLLLAQGVSTFSGFVSYPFDTIARRMMMQSWRSKEEVMYKNSIDCIKKMAREEGLDSFFKGGLTNAIRSLGGAFVLVFFEKFRSRM